MLAEHNEINLLDSVYKAITAAQSWDGEIDLLLIGKNTEKVAKKASSIKLLNIHSLRPINSKLLNEIKKFKKIIVVEEHSIIGGLYSIVSETITSHNLKKEVKSISLPAKFGPTGNYEFLLDFHNLMKRK